MRLINITKEFGGKPVFRGLNLEIEDGRFTAILGPSGSGKTTLLRIIAAACSGSACSGSACATGSGGFTYGGTVEISSARNTEAIPAGTAEGGDAADGGTQGRDAGDGKTAGVPCAGTEVAFMFQEPRLLPWLTAARNVAAPLRAKHVDAMKTAAEWLGRVELAGSEDKYPSELSGGMARRVALARTLAYVSSFERRGVVLLDEPFKELDPELKRRMTALTRESCAGNTVIVVTHDIADAERLGCSVIRFA